MRARTLTALFLVGSAGPALAQDDGATRLYGGALVIDLPAGFSAVSEAAVAERYGSGNPPDFVFAAADSSVEIGISLRNLPSVIAPADYAEGVAATLPRRVDGATWLGEGVRAVGDTEVAWLEFLTPADTAGADARYNYQLAALDEDRLLAINISCARDSNACRDEAAALVERMTLELGGQ
jgi:hypothetical protein